jgi:hypothetical protein
MDGRDGEGLTRRNGCNSGRRSVGKSTVRPLCIEVSPPLIEFRLYIRFFAKQFRIQTLIAKPPIETLGQCFFHRLSRPE